LVSDNARELGKASLLLALCNGAGVLSMRNRNTVGRADMSKRVVASLIVCVALLTQLGASFWGAAAARDGIAPCHRVMTVSTTTAGDAAGKSTGAPAPHDHASCSLCQLGFSVVNSDAPVFVAENLAYHFRVALTEPDLPAPRAIFNRSAPARAPPSRV
jgi:Protein of unknown function (DUF2946)